MILDVGTLRGWLVDEQFAVVFDALRQLMEPPQTDPPEVDYHTLIERKRRAAPARVPRVTTSEAERPAVAASGEVGRPAPSERPVRSRR